MATGNVVAGYPIIAQDVRDELARLAQLHTATTVASTTTESGLQTLPISAGTAVVGSVYQLRAYGTLAVTGTPTITFLARIGAVGDGPGIVFPAVTVRSGAADGYWEVDVMFTCVTTGASATWAPFAKYRHNFLTSVTTYTNVGPITGAPVTRDSTVAQSVVLSCIWGTSSASNTITCRGSFARQVA